MAETTPAITKTSPKTIGLNLTRRVWAEHWSTLQGAGAVLLRKIRQPGRKARRDLRRKMHQPSRSQNKKTLQIFRLENHRVVYL